MVDPEEYKWKLTPRGREKCWTQSHPNSNHLLLAAQLQKTPHIITINGKAFLLARQMMLMQSCSNDDVKKPKQNYFMLFSTCNFIILSRLWKQTAPADKRRTLESYSKFCMCLYLLITACREWNLARLRILNSHQNKPLRSFLWGAESLRKCTVQN